MARLRTHNRRRLTRLRLAARAKFFASLHFDPNETFEHPFLEEEFLSSLRPKKAGEKRPAAQRYVPSPFDIYTPGGASHEDAMAFAAQQGFEIEELRLWSRGSAGSRSSWINFRLPNEDAYMAYVLKFGHLNNYDMVMGSHFDGDAK